MKIEEITIPSLHPQLNDFIGQVSNLLNTGKYQFEVLSAIPTYTTTEGSAVLYASGDVRRFYTYLNGQWNYFGFLDSQGKIVVDGEISIGSFLRADGTNGMWLGHSNYSSAPFRVSLAGALVATSATITGTITASDGSIGGWTIGSGILSSGSGINAVGMQPGSYPFYAGGSTPSTAPFRVNSLGYVTCEALNVTGAVIQASEITGNIVQTSANPGSSRVKMYGGGLLGFDATLGLTFKIPTDGTAPIFANGIIQSATIIDTEIISNEFYTSSEYPRLELTDSGLTYRESAGGTLYGSGAKYGDGTLYGGDAAFYVGNPSKPILSVELERTLADLRLFNRSSVPAGAGIVGDISVVSSKIGLCTGAGTPGTYTYMMSYPASTAQGDLLYLSAADTLARLAKDTNSTRYLSNTGTSNNPAWAQVDLSNGVTGSLPDSNLAQITTASKVAFSALVGAAASGANTDITSLGGITDASGSKNIFNRITYEGNATDNRNIAHGLGRTPEVVLIIPDPNDRQNPWVIWLSGFTSGWAMSSDGGGGQNYIQSADGTNVQIGNDVWVNDNNITYVMICF